MAPIPHQYPHIVNEDNRMYSRGQGMIEYGLIIALVAIVVIAALVYLGPQIALILFSKGGGNL